MKKFYLSLAVLILSAAWIVVGFPALAQIESNFDADAELVSTSIVISQFQAGGGVAEDEFVELHNIGTSAVNLNGFRLVYRSAAGVSDVGPFAAWTTSTVIQPGQFYLVASTLYDGGVTPDITYSPSSCACSMSVPGGGLALRPSVSGTPIDSVGWGTATNIFIETAVAASPANNNSESRNLNGCQDTDNNANDFTTTIPGAARNKSSTPVVCSSGPTPTPTPSPTPTPTPSPTPTPGPGSGAAIVISQFQAGGGVAEDEFVELHNVTSSPVDINGYRLVYRSAAGTTDVGPFATWTNSTVLQPGQYYLIASTGYDGGVTPDVTYNPASCSCSMSATGGGLALRPTVSGVPIDMVGWGTATNAFIEAAVTAAPPVNDSRSRLNNGCQDTDNNANDYSATSPAAAKNRAAAPFVCGGGGGANLFASMGANPTTVVPGGTTLLTVSVTPATTPPSTGIAVVGDLSTIGGSASQTFFDNGTNGDVTAGDNVFSYLDTIPAGTIGGVHNVSAVASDAQSRTVNLNQSITVNAPLPDEDPLLFGNPSNATADTANETNYLMVKPQYSLSYSRAKATPNWVAWRLDSSWVGSAPRQDDYRPDPLLPSAWYHVQDADYSGSGYDRGHMCPSGDRTRSIPDNSATFLMTNFVPQLGANNQGPWNDFEVYLRTLAGQGNEIYIITGPSGTIGTIASGRIVVPQVTWKVVIVLPNGTDDVHRVSRATRAFGIIVPNQPPINSNQWRNYRVTVDAVEYLTGYNFFDQIPKNTQEIIERRRDKQ